MENILITRSGSRQRVLAIPTDTLIAQLRAAGREELIHYAGAAHRDPVAWHMCEAYIADTSADEPTLKSRALKAAYGWGVSPDQLRAVRSAIAASPDFVPTAA